MTRSKFTPDRRDAYLKAKALGVPNVHAAAAAGWHPATAKGYVSAAEDAQVSAEAGATLTPRQKQLVAFLADVKAAEAQHVQSCLAVIIRAAQSPGGKHWTAAAWMLERLYPDQFGRRTVVIEGSPSAPLEVRVTAESLLAQLAHLPKIHPSSNGGG